jgi:hypothetical protein
MAAFRIQTGIRHRLLLGAFVLYLFGLLGFLGPSHSHHGGPAGENCQLCQVSSQPFLAAVPAVAPVEHPALRALCSADRPSPVAPRHFHFASRGPPAA